MVEKDLGAEIARAVARRAGAYCHSTRAAIEIPFLIRIISTLVICGR
jgi:hypothetical protein